MSKDWKTIAEGRDAIKSTNDTTVIREMGIDFVGPIKTQGNMGAHYIISTAEYMTRWVEAQLFKDCTAGTTTKFLFENILARFGCSKILMSDCGTHFVNETISALME